jgi:regulator of protease activity HflC (stomatin/prohibitin superfamily)
MDDRHDENNGSQQPSNRRASVQLRDRSQTDRSEQHRRMDSANQSLADALRITYKLLQGGMLVLVALYLISGLQSINEGERGIAVRFGKIVKPNLEPGFQWSWPYPIGEIVRVGEGSVELPIGTSFMPNLPGDKSIGNVEEKAMEADIRVFSSSRQLNPVRDGSNLTADLNIAHTQWRVYYRRSNHAEFVANILPRQEDAIVRVAVERGVVQSIATIDIDDLIKSSNESVSSRVRGIAQKTLDNLDSGITIDRVVLARKSPPMSLMNQFSNVQSAAQNAGKAREDAMLLREQTLNDTAGASSEILIAQINEFERFTEIGDFDGAERTLVVIDKLLNGEEVEIDGEFVQGQSSGLVSELINRASATSSARVSQAIADYELFEAKFLQYEANPKLMVARDWSEAMALFLNKGFVSTIVLPTGVNAEMLINNDPDIVKELERAERARVAQKAKDERLDQFLRDVHRTQRGIKDPEQ